MVHPLWKTVWKSLKKLKIEQIELPHELPAIPLLGIYPKKSKMLIQKDICNAVFTEELFTITRI